MNERETRLMTLADAYATAQAAGGGQQRALVASCGKPSLSCPHMKGRENDTSMSHEHYDCKICGGHIALDYDEMR